MKRYSLIAAATILLCGLVYVLTTIGFGRQFSVVNTLDRDGHAIQILVPSSYDPEVGAPVVIYHHGVGETERGWVEGDGLRKAGVRDALIAEGYILAASAAAGDNWGNQKGVDAYQSLYDYLGGHYQITGVVFLSQSMGGLTGLLCLANEEIPCRGWYGIYPVCNLADMQDTRFAEAITAAHPSGTEGHDPALLSPTEFPPVPLRFTASPRDTVVGKGTHSDAMAALLDERMPEADVVPCNGDHGHPSHFIPQDVVDFFSRCLDRAN